MPSVTEQQLRNAVKQLYIVEGNLATTAHERDKTVVNSRLVNYYICSSTQLSQQVYHKMVAEKINELYKVFSSAHTFVYKLKTFIDMVFACLNKYLYTQIFLLAKQSIKDRPGHIINNNGRHKKQAAFFLKQMEQIICSVHSIAGSAKNFTINLLSLICYPVVKRCYQCFLLQAKQRHINVRTTKNNTF